MRLMRSFAATLALATLAVGSATAQVSQTVDMQFKSAGNVSAFGVRVGPYRGAMISEPGSPVIDLYCVDYYNHVSMNQTWTANLTSVGAMDLSSTRWGMVYGTHDARIRYAMAAWLTGKFAQLTPTSTNWGRVHAAIWNVFTPGAPGSTSATVQQYLLDARLNFASVNLSHWTVVTDVRTRGATGGVQEFLTPMNVTPEPETWLLLGTGLVALFGAALAGKRVA